MVSAWLLRSKQFPSLLQNHSHLVTVTGNGCIFLQLGLAASNTLTTFLATGPHSFFVEVSRL